MQIVALLLVLAGCCCRYCSALQVYGSGYYGADDYYSTTQQEETTTTTMTPRPSRWPKPLIPICCSPGHYYRLGKCFEIELDDDPSTEIDFPQIYTDDFKPSNITSDDFRRIYYYPCIYGSFGIDPNFDVHFFMENGTIYTENLTDPSLITQNDYCLAMLFNKINRTYSTIVAVCLPEEVQVPKFFSLTSLLSAIFLSATFFIYVVIPDLQNFHGIIVRAYVGMLMSAYLALAVVQLGDQAVLETEELCQALDALIHVSQFYVMKSFGSTHLLALTFSAAVYGCWVLFSRVSKESRGRMGCIPYSLGQNIYHGHP